MSTEIQISKKIAVLEEGALITPNVNQIDFVGNGVNASTVGDSVTVNIPGSTGSTTYYMNQSVTQTPYKEFSSVATLGVEQIVPATVLAGATSIIAEYQTPTGVPGTTQIPTGLWQFFLHFNAGTAGQNWIIRPSVYSRDLGGIETLLLTLDPVIVTNMPTVTTMYISDAVFPATTVLTTDRIVVKIAMENTTGVSQTVNFRTEGTQHYSVGLTTLNQVIPAAGVTGSGSTNYVSKFTSSTSIGNSGIFDNGTNVGIGTISPSEKLEVTGNTKLNGTLSVNDSSATLNVVGNAFGQASLISPTGAIILTAGYGGVNINGANPNLQVDGKTTTSQFQLTTTPTAGYVLTSDASGNGTWAVGGSASGVFGISNATGVYTYYSTLTLAMAAATSGQVIEMFADVTETGAVSVTLKTGVNINGNGHTYTLSNSGTNNALIDNAIAVSCEIHNIKIIRKTGTTVSNTSNLCLSITSLTSQIKCSGAFFVNTSGYGIRNEGSLWGVSILVTCATGAGIFTLGNLYDSYVESTDGLAILAYNGNVYNCKGITTSIEPGIYVQSGTCKVYNSFGKSTAGTGLNGSGKFYNTTGISTTSNGIEAADGAEFNQCIGISTSGFGINGNGHLAYQCRFISSSGYGAGAGTNAEHYDCIHESTTNLAVFGYVGLKLYRGVAYSKWNNAGGHAFVQWTAGSGSVLNNVFLRTTNASANCINSGGVAATISYSHNSYLGATTPISSFITQTLINTEDNQGNIKL